VPTGRRTTQGLAVNDNSQVLSQYIVSVHSHDFVCCVGNYRCNRWVVQPSHESYDDELPLSTIDEEMAARILAEQETDPNLMDTTYGTARHESLVSRKRSLEVARFIHHYERWCAHAESARLEQSLRVNVCKRLAPVAQKAVEYDGGLHVFGGKGLSFVHSAFTELLECRSMLQHSYAFAFFQYKSEHDTIYKLLLRQMNEKTVFERLQSELELLTEQISNVVARTHIRATETQIIYLTKMAAGKRREFTNFMIDILWREEGDSKKESKSTHDHRRQLSLTALNRIDNDDEDTEAADEAIRRSLAAYEEIDRNFGHQDRNDVYLLDWTCAACTFMNAGNFERCDMCNTHR
jgi:Ariadne domain